MALGGSGNSGGRPDLSWMTLSAPSPACVRAGRPLPYSVDACKLCSVKLVCDEAMTMCFKLPTGMLANWCSVNWPLVIAVNAG